MSTTRKTLTLLLNIALVLSVTLIASAETGSVEGPEEVVTASDAARGKIVGSLLDEIEASSGGKQLQFVAHVVAGTDLSPYTDRWFARPFVDPLGTTAAVGFARPSALLKMAANPNVIILQGPESLAELPEIQDEDLEGVLNATIEPQINTDPDASPGPAPEGWYHTTGAVHGSQEAWAKGYTGEGVRYMSNDTGADYCHPDLHGTWAYIEDETSDYYGLPEMFDSYSSYLAALDFYLGTNYIANGLADYADTSATTAGPTFQYAPLGAAVVHTYTVPGTSESGVYHYGSHPDKALALWAGLLNAWFGDGSIGFDAEGDPNQERAAVLVVDEDTAGVYDTVYVDLNYNFDFTDDEPARLGEFTGHETACMDYDNDHLNDVSGGLVYFISDGSTPLPTLDWLWGIPGPPGTYGLGWDWPYGPGDLVAFHVQDFLDPGGTHGQGTTSVATGQGVVRGSIYVGPDGYDVADNRGLVVGPGKDVASTQNGNFGMTPFLEDAFIYAGLGYDGIPGTGDDVQIVSNSWGFSGTDNDGFDYYSRLIDDINRTLAPNTAVLFSTGNGAAGYGTAAPPSPATGIGVGASTLYGSIGLFEPIASMEQIVGGDPMSWSNRGPGVRNVSGVDVVATGAFGTGDLSLNEVLWGAIATANFGGTSMAAPVAAGNLALMYDAWHQRTGRWPTFTEARELLMGTCQQTDHDVWTQGAGLVDADEGTDVAGGHGGIYASAPDWSVGDYRGTEYPAFAHVIHPGESDIKTFTLHNTSGKRMRVDLSALTFKLINTRDYSFTSLDQSLDHGAFTTPDYVFRIDEDIPGATELLMVRVTKPYEQFDPNNDLMEPFNNWRVHLQNWTDLDEDGNFWEDTNGNGKVDVGEMDANEYIRFTYGYDAGPSQQVRIANPLDRKGDGILLTFRHRDKAPSVPHTDLTVEASYWQWTNWNWAHVNRKKVTVPAGATAEFQVRIKVPPRTPYGMYQGMIVAESGDSEVIIPVTLAVAARGTSFEFGQENWHDNNPRYPLYDNEHVFGYTDYTWRAEAGDWRFFSTDIPDGSLPTTGESFLIVDNAWEGDETDIDTIVLGPTPDGFGPTSRYGPYTLAEVGRSAYNYIGSGRWRLETSSGGPREMIAAPAQEGLHSILFHQVKVDGQLLNEPFGGEVGLANLDPAEITASGPAGMGSMKVTISSEIELTGFVAEGFGLGAPNVTWETVQQDDPDDPSTASFTKTVEIEHGALLEVSTCCSVDGSDIDLFIYDPDGNRVGASTTPDDEESVRILFPEDGTYTIAVHGWSVPAGTDTFQLTVNAVQGYDVQATDLPDVIPAGGSGTVTVEWDTTGFAAGTYYGLVLMGPDAAPGLFEVPVEITVE